MTKLHASGTFLIQLCELNRMASVICAKFFIQRVKTAICCVAGGSRDPILRPLPWGADDDQTTRQWHISNSTLRAESIGIGHMR